MEVELTKNVRSRMLSSLKKARRREVGGMLMAKQIEPGMFSIVDFTIDEFTGSANQFLRSPDRHRAALDDFFSRTGNDYSRYNYLGDWHSHPNHSHLPSSIDILSMQDLLEEERGINFAILLIVKRGWLRRFFCSAMLFRQNEEPFNIEVFVRK